MGFNYDENYNYDSPQRAAQLRERNANYAQQEFDQSKVEQMYAAAETSNSHRGGGGGGGGGRNDRGGNNDLSLNLTLSPRSSKHGSDYISELLDYEKDTEITLAGMYNKGFEAFFKKSKREKKNQAQAQTALLKGKKR